MSEQVWGPGNVARHRAIINADLVRAGKNAVPDGVDDLAFANQVRPTYDAFRWSFATEEFARQWLAGIARRLK